MTHDMRHWITIVESAQVNEIDRANFTGPDSLGKTSIDYDYQLLGKMGKLNIYSDNELMHIVATMGDAQERLLDTVISLELEPTRQPKGIKASKSQPRMVMSMSIAKKYRGHNLAPKLYRWLLLNTPLILEAGESQSAGGASIWNRLAAYPDIFVFAQTSNHSLIELEPSQSGELEPVDARLDSLYSDEHESVNLTTMFAVAQK